jgi:branched-chain amino acid transport system substrate-binding protein
VLSRRKFICTTATASGSVVAAETVVPKSSAASIPVGSALPLSGVAAADGIEFQRGLELAAEEINALGGVLGRKVELYFEDTADMGADTVLQAMQRLVDHRDCGVIINGSNVGTNMAEMELAAENDILFVHYNTTIVHNEKFNSNPDKYYGSFQGDPPEFYYGPGVLLYFKGLIDSGKWSPVRRNLAIVSSANQYSVTIANAVREQASHYGFTVSLYETVPFPNSQWGPTLAKIRRDPPAAIVITHFLPQDLTQFMRQFIVRATPSIVYMQYGPSLPAFREIGREAIEGVLYSTVIGCLPDAFSGAFRAKYVGRYGRNAAYLTGSQTYDGLWHWSLAAAIAGGAGEPYGKVQNRNVARALRRLIYRGVNGTCRFDTAGQSACSYPTQVSDPSLGMPHQFLQHQDYRLEPVLISPAPYARGEFRLPPWIKQQ